MHSWGRKNLSGSDITRVLTHALRIYHMIQQLQRIGASVCLLLLSATMPAIASEGSFTGYVVHVSTNNLKVENESNQTLSFMLVPHFDQVFAFDGKTTYQMKRIKPGTWVRVKYDQHFMGMRHADRIILINRRGHLVKIGG